MIDRPRRRGILRTGLGSLVAPLHSLSVEAKDQATQPTQVAPTAPVWPAWKSFRARFMNEDGRILSGAEGTGQTYSEAQAYALFFALVGYDRLAFDKILAWTENNLCGSCLAAQSRRFLVYRPHSLAPRIARTSGLSRHCAPISS